MAGTIASALVTGGAGFIGSHLVDALAASGCRVTVLDDLSTGSRANLEAAAGRVRLVQADLRDPAALADAVAGCEVVFHLAAVVSVPRTIADPLGSAAVNETGSLQLLEAARAARVRRVVFASSSAVYGDEPSLPKREQMPPKPLSPYAVQKLAVEHYLKVYNDLFGLEAAALRFFNVFGPRQDPSSAYSGVISIFMARALDGMPPLIHGDGSQTRDFVYVGDVVAALIAAATAAAAAGRVFNVGTGGAVSIRRLWAEVARLAGAACTPRFGPRRAGDVPHSVAAVAAAAEGLNFSPRVGFEQGLALTLGWFKENRKGP
ncbi:MAG: SDR family NAD(P)-dependent oxidoreductase [Desulfobacterales bacterium]|jgi:UDP-glucose 4-epimerase|nr:SDR family NAD(P)-dependent oxidoreductase [Desulfobacterales bacterium]